MSDAMDTKLREYAARWQAQQPADPVPDQSRWTQAVRAVPGDSVRTPRQRPYAWVPILAVAASVILVAGGIAVVQILAAPPPAVPGSVTGGGPVPWRPMPTTNPDPPTVTISPKQIGTVFTGIEVELQLPASVAAGQPLDFTVTLIAPAGRDVALVPCPDYAIAFGSEGNETSVGYALNCAGVPYRDAGGVPYLPAGVPVTFAMLTSAPPVRADGLKLTWQLTSARNLDSVVGGGTIDVT